VTLQNAPKQFPSTRVSENASNLNPQSYNKPLRSDSSALFLPLMNLKKTKRKSNNFLNLKSVTDK